MCAIAFADSTRPWLPVTASKTSAIRGSGCAVPTRIVTNADLAELFETSDDWILQRTGICERRYLPPGLAASDLATDAARSACRSADLQPGELDCTIVGTVTPDRRLLLTAVYVQTSLGARACPAFDLSGACAGFLYGFFGDGACAVLVGPTSSTGPSSQIASVVIGADGSGAEHLFVPGGGSRQPATSASIANNLHTVKMNGAAVVTNAVRTIARSCQQVLVQNGLRPEEVDLVVPHQANLRIIEGVAARCGIPLERFFVNIQRYGNTSAASVPIALDEAAREGRPRKGMNVLLCALGAGFAWGTALLHW
jgi:3-oxoacyl-[acyl-carrier-protein] synthase-3